MMAIQPRKVDVPVIADNVFAENPHFAQFALLIQPKIAAEQEQAEQKIRVRQAPEGRVFRDLQADMQAMRADAEKADCQINHLAENPRILRGRFRHVAQQFIASEGQFQKAPCARVRCRQKAVIIHMRPKFPAAPHEIEIVKIIKAVVFRIVPFFRANHAPADVGKFQLRA